MSLLLADDPAAGAAAGLSLLDRVNLHSTIGRIGGAALVMVSALGAWGRPVLRAPTEEAP